MSFVSMIDTELTKTKIMKVSDSPSGQYTIEQEYMNVNTTGQAVDITLHKEILGILDINYRVKLNQYMVLSDIEWIDEKTFTIDGELTEVKY